MRNAYLSGLTGEVIGRLERTSDALINGGIATIVGAEDRVLESTRVGDIHVELAVLRVANQSTQLD